MRKWKTSSPNRRAPTPKKSFRKNCKETGLTVDDLKSDIRRQLSVQKLLNREVVAKISITDQDVIDFYNQNRAQFNVAEPQYHIAQIVVTPRPDPRCTTARTTKPPPKPRPSAKIALIEQKLDEWRGFFAAGHGLFGGLHARRPAAIWDSFPNPRSISPTRC